MPNKSKPDPADEIHAALSSFSRQTIRANRICKEIADRQQALETAEDAITAAVLILTPLLERQPKDTAYRYLDTVYWLDPTEGICHRSLREWTDLLHQDDDEPRGTFRESVDEATAAGLLRRGRHDDDEPEAKPAIVMPYLSIPAKPKSYAERMATEPYEPPTDAQIDEGAFYEAVKAEPLMSDEVVEAITDAWDGGDMEMVQSIVNAVAANGRGA